MAFRLMISQDLQNLPNARLCGNDRILLSAYVHIIGTGVCALVEVSCLTESLAFSLNPIRGS